MKKNKISKRISIVIGCLYLAAVTGATIYAQTVYTNNLPEVKLAKIASGMIAHTETVEAEQMGEKLVVKLSLQSPLFPAAALTEQSIFMVNQGSEKISCRLLEVNVDNEYVEAVIEPAYGDFEDGQRFQCEIKIDNTVEFRNTVPRSVIGTDGDGDFCINIVEQTDGPWGKKYIVSQEKVLIWPDEGTDRVVIYGKGSMVKLPLAETVNMEALQPRQEVRIVK